MSDTKQQKVAEILKLKTELQRLVKNVRDQRVVCEKIEQENQYLQDYIGSVMQTKDIS